MFSVPHLVIIFIVVLVVFGPHRLPELARGLGKMMAEFRKASTDFKMAFEEEMRTIERQAKELEFKKAQEAAAAANPQPQGATLATLAEAETPKILPENVAPPDPVVTPVTESVSREFHASEAQSATDELPATEATPREGSPEPGSQPSHDQRQPA
jgi:sec-independent protein translocase protein TatB